MSYLKRIANAHAEVNFSQEELVFYARHLLLPSIGTKGQQKLKAARVLVVGAGGLGCPALQGLAGAGVGHISIIDGDNIELSNLARQWLHSSKDLDCNKAESAKRSIIRLNPYLQVESLCDMLTQTNAETLIASHDLIIDATDDMHVRYLIDAVCAKFNRPWIHAALYRNKGQVCALWDSHGASFKTLYPNKNEAPSCVEAGILGVSASLIANIQVLEAIKFITGCEQPKLGTIISVDSFNYKHEYFNLPNVKQPKLIESETKTSNHTCSAEDLRQRLSISEPIRLIDIRSIQLHRKSAIEGSERMDVDHLLKADFSKERRVVIYCEEGSISELVVCALRSQNRNATYHLKGGFQSWLFS